LAEQHSVREGNVIGFLFGKLRFEIRADNSEFIHPLHDLWVHVVCLSPKFFFWRCSFKPWMRNHLGKRHPQDGILLQHAFQQIPERLRQIGRELRRKGNDLRELLPHR
jgi:hypothetical protein